MVEPEAYTQFCKTLCQPMQSVLARLTENDVALLHAGFGVAGEAGEVVDLLKKAVFNNHPLDLQKLTLELGDIEFYLEMLRQTTGISRDQVLQSNIDKLSARFPGLVYTHERSRLRSDCDQPAAKA